MSMESLRLALRLRHRAVAVAQQEMVKSLDAERGAEGALAEASAAIAREIAAAMAADAGDAEVDALGRWLRGARAVEARAEAVLADAEAAAARSRAALGAARSAEAAVDALIEAREQEIARRDAQEARAVLEQAAERKGLPEGSLPDG
jgi:hypothetical protein